MFKITSTKQFSFSTFTVCKQNENISIQWALCMFNLSDMTYSASPNPLFENLSLQYFPLGGSPTKGRGGFSEISIIFLPVQWFRAKQYLPFPLAPLLDHISAFRFFCYLRSKMSSAFFFLALIFLCSCSRCVTKSWMGYLQANLLGKIVIFLMLQFYFKQVGIGTGQRVVYLLFVYI